jgi:hypothetical protein
MLLISQSARVLANDSESKTVAKDAERSRRRELEGSFNLPRRIESECQKGEFRG